MDLTQFWADTWVQFVGGAAVLGLSNTGTWLVASRRRPVWQLVKQTDDRWILQRLRRRPAFATTVKSIRSTPSTTGFIGTSPGTSRDFGPSKRMELVGVAADDVLEIEWVEKKRLRLRIPIVAGSTTIVAFRDEVEKMTLPSR